ncbi:MAG: hypothetical protein RL097_611 [Candidatus Parcubacteria bacterium]
MAPITRLYNVSVDSATDSYTIKIVAVIFNTPITQELHHEHRRIS